MSILFRARAGRLAVVALALGLPLGLPVLPVQAAPVQAAPRARTTQPDSLFPGVGNLGYDVTHYDIALAYRSTSRTIRATTTITARAARPLTHFALDLEGLQVTAVRVDGRAATFTRSGTKLQITPARLVRGRFTTVVSYGGSPVTHLDPDGAEDGWIPTPDGATALNEPVGAMTWFPSNNTPRDKATFSFAVTAPRRLEVASNGRLESRRTVGASTTWTWRQQHPMATYLAMVSIGNYRVYHSSMTLTSGRRIPVWSFVDASLGTLAAQRRLLPKIIRAHESRFGPYPFDSAGIVVKKIDVGYALETQDRPFFDGTPDTATLAHELAHQWYGDSVTPKDWGDIWLNEGFATDAEWRYGADHGGPSTAEQFREAYDEPASSSLWSPAPDRLSDPADLFGDPVYTRGAMTLEALRQEIGDPAFDTLLRRWAGQRRGQVVSTGQFVALAERVSGRDLHPFFHTWLEVAAKPAGY